MEQEFLSWMESHKDNKVYDAKDIARDLLIETEEDNRKLGLLMQKFVNEYKLEVIHVYICPICKHEKIYNSIWDIALDGEEMFCENCGDVGTNENIIGRFKVV
jgi:hypothetical protein